MMNGYPSALDKMKALIAQLERWEGYITSALHHGKDTHNFDDIVNMIMANRLLFFSYQDAFILMEKVDYPQFSNFHCFLAGGDMQAIIDAEESIMKVGHDIGCKYLSISGRHGWVRKLEPNGWEHVCSTMYKPIKEILDGQGEGRSGRNDGGVARRN